jgi:hypothetical protein
MADHFYGVNIGQALGEVSTGTSTTSKKVELRVEDSVSGNSKVEVLLAIDKLRAHIATAADLTP